MIYEFDDDRSVRILSDDRSVWADALLVPEEPDVPEYWEALVFVEGKREAMMSLSVYEGGRRACEFACVQAVTAVHKYFRKPEKQSKEEKNDGNV